MTNRSKAKGTTFESEVVRLAKEMGYAKARRIALAGTNDQGDVDLLGDMTVIIECKAHAAWSDGQVIVWLGDTERERVNAGADHGFLVLKRPRKPIEHAWAVSTVDVYMATSGRWAPRPVYMYLVDYLTKLQFELGEAAPCSP
jgi:hypothetical protein